MGISFFGRKNCSTNYCSDEEQPAPNPNPDRWSLIQKAEFNNGYVLRVRYLDCTNFEGVKIMVYKGQYIKQEHRDPHFAPGRLSPIARFIPTLEGLRMAVSLANSL